MTKHRSVASQDGVWRAMVAVGLSRVAVRFGGPRFDFRLEDFIDIDNVFLMTSADECLVVLQPFSWVDPASSAQEAKSIDRTRTTKALRLR